MCLSAVLSGRATGASSQDLYPGLILSQRTKSKRRREVALALLDCLGFRVDTDARSVVPMPDHSDPSREPDRYVRSHRTRSLPALSGML